MTANRIVSIITYLLMAVGLVFLILVIYHGDDAINTSGELQDSIVSPFISLATYGIIVTALIAIVYSLYNLFKDVKKAKNALIGIGSLAVIILISYFMSSGADHINFQDGDSIVTESTSKLVGAGLMAFYITIGITIISIIFVELNRAFKR